MRFYCWITYIASFLVGYLAIVNEVWAAPFVCPGGLRPSKQQLGQPENDFFRWGERDESNNFLPHATVSFSFIQEQENDDETAFGGTTVTVFPVADGAGTFPANARQIVRNAFSAWSIVSDITFIEVFEPDQQGQIRVGAHSFENSVVLGHGFFPPPDGTSNNSLCGDLHLNVNENWQNNVEEFFAVAVHEIGHTIGLDHIIDTGEINNIIMFAVVGTMAGPLTIFDQAYAQTIYGPPIPKIVPISGSDNPRQVIWTYPFNPFDPQTFDFTSIDPANSDNPRIPAYEMEFIVCPNQIPDEHECAVDPNALEFDVVISNVDTHDLQTFEIQSTLNGGDGEFTSISSEIPASSTTFGITTLPTGEYNLRMRALYGNAIAEPIFSLVSEPRTLSGNEVSFALTFTPMDDSMVPVTLTLGRDESATINNNDSSLDVEVSNPDNAFFYLTNSQSQVGPGEAIRRLQTE